MKVLDRGRGQHGPSAATETVQLQRSTVSIASGRVKATCVASLQNDPNAVRTIIQVDK